MRDEGFKAFFGKKNKVPVYFLESDFYQDINKITIKQLKRLANKAKCIPEPILYGKFIHDEHFIKTLELVLNSTLETTHRASFYLKKILPQLSSKNNLLDVGPGNGQLTSLMNGKFKQITVVDPCEEAVQTIKKINWEANTKLVTIQDSILKTNLPEKHFDLIMLSHVLYYIEQNKWFEVAELCYKALHPNGIMVIVLSGAKLGKAELMHYFSGRSIDIESFTQQCADRLSSFIENFVSNEDFYAYNLNTILHIAGFLLSDINTFTSKKNLKDYVIKNFKINKNLFKISTQQEFIVIKKPAFNR